MLRSVSSLLFRNPFPAFSTRVQSAKISMEASKAAPLCPRFVPVETPVNGITSFGQRFSIVSYNILAQVYVKSVSFPHSPPSCLRWKARSEAILSLLKGLGTDFLCLQEVDEYDTFYKEKLETLEYSSIYVKRTGKKRDGCGIFYKHNSAELLLQETIEYNDLINSINAVSNASMDGRNVSPVKATETAGDGSVQEDAQGNHGDPNDPCVRLKRDCVGIMGAFRLKGHTDHHVIVANTHLYWDPEWADVKLAQAKYLLSRLARFKMAVSERFNCTPSLILTGDFNSTPGDQVYQQLVSGFSTSHGEVLDDELPIPLVSLHAHTRGEPPFTNCTPGFTGTLDYIFFPPYDSIEPVSVLELPEAESSSVEGGLPNYQHPSDHLPIGAEFKFV